MDLITALKVSPDVVATCLYAYEVIDCINKQLKLVSITCKFYQEKKLMIYCSFFFFFFSLAYYKIM